ALIGGCYYYFTSTDLINQIGTGLKGKTDTNRSTQPIAAQGKISPAPTPPTTVVSKPVITDRDSFLRMYANPQENLGKDLFPVEYAPKDQRVSYWGFIDKSGKLAIPPF